MPHLTYLYRVPSGVRLDHPRAEPGDYIVITPESPHAPVRVYREYGRDVLGRLMSSLDRLELFASPDPSESIRRVVGLPDTVPGLPPRLRLLK